MDLERIARDLPEEVARTLETIVVDRGGHDPQSFMVTEDIVGHVSPGTRYRLDTDGLTPLDGPPGDPAPLPDPSPPPPHVRLHGKWNASEDVESSGANILGGLGTMTLPGTDLAIPEAPATRAALAFYGARLIPVGGEVIFETDQSLPVTVMNIGSAYVRDYLHVEGKGGGSFIEYHDRPHLHMPLDDAATGHILLGRKDGDAYLLSAFRIPFGHAIYTPPYALHADPYLVGRYLVIYSVTDVYSTVVFRSDEGDIVPVRIAAS